MKKTLFAALLITASANLLFAQQDHSNHQKQTTSNQDTLGKQTAGADVTQRQLSQLLTSYYNIKNALVAGDPNSAATNASEFLRISNSIDYKTISEGNVHILSKDASRISETKDLSKQRQIFANLSSNLVSVAKALKMTGQPIYVQYCPMKKASWLSAEKEIRNPYYGSAMLSCGEVKDAL